MPYTRRAAPAILKLLLTKANVYKVDAGVSQIFWIYSVHKFWIRVDLSYNHTLIGTASHGVVKNEWQFAESDFECYLQVCVWNNLEMKKPKHRPILKASPILAKKDRRLILAADSIKFCVQQVQCQNATLRGFIPYTIFSWLTWKAQNRPD